MILVELGQMILDMPGANALYISRKMRQLIIREIIGNRPYMIADEDCELTIFCGLSVHIVPGMPAHYAVVASLPKKSAKEEQCQR